MNKRRDGIYCALHHPKIMNSRTTLLSASELAAMLEGGNPPVLVDARLAEECAAARLPGARGNCVYEVVFEERMKGIAPDRSAAVCVYGNSAQTHEAAMAAEKLCRAGCEEVLVLADGLDGWKAAGFPVESDGAKPPAPAKPELHGAREVNLEESRVEWTGRNLLNRHGGSLGVKSGVLLFEHGRLTGGKFVFDMRDITCADLKGYPLHDVLVAHLASYDFFDVETFPEAQFVINMATPVDDATAGAPNLELAGMLTIKGVSVPLEFVATAGITAEGLPAAQAVLSFDRTLWNIIYGSGKFFRNLGGHLVNDLIEVQVRVVAR